MPTLVAWVFCGVWLACHLLYPLWCTKSGSWQHGLAAFACLFAGASVILAYLRPTLLRLRFESDPDVRNLLAPPRDRVFWGLFAIAVTLHLYPLTLPLHHAGGGGDEVVHMGMPALPFKVWARNVPVPWPAVAWALAVLAIAARSRLDIAGRRAVAVLRDRPVAAWICFAAAGWAYFAALFWVIRRFARGGYPSLPMDILRFPPLATILRLPLYAAFGLSNLVGRLPEFGFFLATGLVFYRLIERERSHAAARLALAVYWLLPAVGYFAIKGSQTNGEVFFFVLTSYFFCAWAAEGRSSALYWATLAVSVGSMYRYTLPLAAFVLIVAVALEIVLNKNRRREFSPRVGLACAAMLAAMIIPWLAAFYYYKSRRVVAAHEFISPSILLDFARRFPIGVSYPVALLAAAGLVLTLLRRKTGWHRYALIFFAAYYALVSIDLTAAQEELHDYARFAMPLYPLLAAWTADAVLFATRATHAATTAGTALALYLLAIGTWVHVPPLLPEFTLRECLATNYLPWTAAGRYLDHLPGGTRLVSLDCPRSCYTFDSMRLHALDWIAVASGDVSSASSLREFCHRNDAQLLIYKWDPGSPEPRNQALIDELEHGAEGFSTRAQFSIGRNRIVFKNVE